MAMMTCLGLATTQDFIDFGFEPEFIGRIPIRVSCRSLSSDDLYDVLKYSEGSIIRQYQRNFLAYGIDATFTDKALRCIAEHAYQERTGARGIMTVCENILRDFKFELPSTNIDGLVITPAVCNNPQAELRKLLKKRAASKMPPNYPQFRGLVVSCWRR